jgi:ATP-dependent RNA/DNA helicase IGHMBP2
METIRYFRSMEDLHPHIGRLLKCIDLEEKEEVRRYSLDQQQSLRSLKAEGLALHPLKVIRKSFGYADYPEVQFRLNFPGEVNHFKDGAAIECFINGEEPIKGVLINLDGKSGEFRLFAPDFPDWIEDEGMGIKLSPDQRTTSLMKRGLRELSTNNALYPLFTKIHDEQQDFVEMDEQRISTIQLRNTSLNESQQNAVRAIVVNDAICLVHGPPGTGKTTTLIESVWQLVQQNEKVLVAAPSNAAIDNIALGLHRVGLKLLRVGNTTKVSDAIFPFTIEGHLSDAKQKKEIKELKIRAEQFRKMALKYKRSFGKAEREQRSLLFKEVKNIRTEIRKIQAYHEEKLFHNAQVIVGTPIGLLDALTGHTAEKMGNISFDTLVIDEAGQCIEPLAWCIFPLAKKFVLAGDPFQLPPTVLSEAASRMGFNKSILEVCFDNIRNIHLLNMQYRMRASIAGFSSQYFYEGKLQTASHLQNQQVHVTFFDTAGTGYAEERGSNGVSLLNEGEMEVVQKILQSENLDINQTAVISPYAGQIILAKEKLSTAMRISTIDSFQGQEQENIIITLVRSNDEQIIGFLNDYRRMNVAITRAKEKLFVIGDSATLGKDSFYTAFFEYVEQHGAYRSAWELSD